MAMPISIETIMERCSALFISMRRTAQCLANTQLESFVNAMVSYGSGVSLSMPGEPERKLPLLELDTED